MAERTIIVNKVQPPNGRGQILYQVVTRRRALDEKLGTLEQIFSVTEGEACELINQLVRAMVGGDDG